MKQYTIAARFFVSISSFFYINYLKNYMQTSENNCHQQRLVKACKQYTVE